MEMHAHSTRGFTDHTLLRFWQGWAWLHVWFEIRFRFTFPIQLGARSCRWLRFLTCYSDPTLFTLSYLTGRLSHAAAFPESLHTTHGTKRFSCFYPISDSEMRRANGACSRSRRSLFGTFTIYRLHYMAIAQIFTYTPRFTGLIWSPRLAAVQDSLAQSQLRYSSLRHASAAALKRAAHASFAHSGYITCSRLIEFTFTHFSPIPTFRHNTNASSPNEMARRGLLLR